MADSGACRLPGRARGFRKADLALLDKKARRSHQHGIIVMKAWIASGFFWEPLIGLLGEFLSRSWSPRDVLAVPVVAGLTGQLNLACYIL
ncbi:hypothetical protein Taro_043399 [Colocasia esculenta]|uniref:Uncharacterized protein n=1 Tax=Colocasia esculenta TaxID=4460 RepID=A0A843X0M0_COLES|nr:hypothetical protein [Colocasia esculenta]